ERAGHDAVPEADDVDETTEFVDDIDGPSPSPTAILESYGDGPSSLNDTASTCRFSIASSIEPVLEVRGKDITGLPELVEDAISTNLSVVSVQDMSAVVAASPPPKSSKSSAFIFISSRWMTASTIWRQRTAKEGPTPAASVIPLSTSWTNLFILAFFKAAFLVIARIAHIITITSFDPFARRSLKRIVSIAELLIEMRSGALFTSTLHSAHMRLGGVSALVGTLFLSVLAFEQLSILTIVPVTVEEVVVGSVPAVVNVSAYYDVISTRNIRAGANAGPSVQVLNISARQSLLSGYAASGMRLTDNGMLIPDGLAGAWAYPPQAVVAVGAVADCRTVHTNGRIYVNHLDGAFALVRNFTVGLSTASSIEDLGVDAGYSNIHMLGLTIMPAGDNGATMAQLDAVLCAFGSNTTDAYLAGANIGRPSGQFCPNIYGLICQVTPGQGFVLFDNVESTGNVTQFVPEPLPIFGYVDSQTADLIDQTTLPAQWYNPTYNITRADINALVQRSFNSWIGGGVPPSTNSAPTADENVNEDGYDSGYAWIGETEGLVYQVRQRSSFSALLIMLTLIVMVVAAGGGWVFYNMNLYILLRRYNLDAEEDGPAREEAAAATAGAGGRQGSMTTLKRLKSIRVMGLPLREAHREGLKNVTTVGGIVRLAFGSLCQDVSADNLLQKDNALNEEIKKRTNVREFATALQRIP
ncbi:hypothetical protein HK101_001377, partial [Irineochytrium annulatum]